MGELPDALFQSLSDFHRPEDSGGGDCFVIPRGYRFLFPVPVWGDVGGGAVKDHQHLLAGGGGELSHQQSAASPAESPLNGPGHWDFFLSHGQAAAGDQVKMLCFLQRKCG